VARFDFMAYDFLRHILREWLMEIDRKLALSGRVTESGRLSLPAELRRKVGLDKGGPVRIDIVDGSIRITTMSEVKDRIRNMARSSGLTKKASVAGFLDWRAGERAAENKDKKR
jgi:bifunctional DNA-binding transcriptional regulator/antitoxin component of YhaV-PrlF toxin-antitoxin module